MEQKEKFRPLSAIAELKYGIKTGATKFFVLNKDSAKKFGIEKRFLEPILHSTKEIKKIVLRDEDIESVLFNSNLNKIEMRGTKALSYINMGEIKGINKVSSVKGRIRWYDAGLQDAPEIIITQFYGERHFAIYNKNRAQIENTFFGIKPKNNIAPILLAAYLNSSLFALTKELYGRVNLGEGVLTIYGTDWKSMPVLDVENITKEQKEKLEKAFLQMAKREILSVEKEVESKDHQRLDEIIFDIVNLSKIDREEVYTSLKELVKERATKANSVKKNGKNGKGKKKKHEEEFSGEQSSLLTLL